MPAEIVDSSAPSVSEVPPFSLAQHQLQLTTLLFDYKHTTRQKGTSNVECVFFPSITTHITQV